MGIQLGAPRSGILNPPPRLLPANQQHQCKTPGSWSRWLEQVEAGSLYRCEDCGQIWEWLVPDIYTRNYRWGKADKLAEWIIFGGRQ